MRWGMFSGGRLKVESPKKKTGSPEPRVESGRLARCIAILSIALTVPLLAGSPAGQAVLEKSDISLHSPENFRARVRITAGEGTKRGTSDVEVWRSGDRKTLVRFLEPKEKGKFLVRIDGVLWFISPGAKNPVKLTPSFKLRGGASLEEILGIRYTRDYDVENATEEKDDSGPLDVLDLRAKSKSAPYPKIRYIVRRNTNRPVRAEYRLPSGKVFSVVEFAEWQSGSRPLAKKLVIRDPLKPGAPTAVEFLEFEERPVPAALFDLHAGDEREKLTKTPAVD